MVRSQTQPSLRLPSTLELLVIPQHGALFSLSHFDLIVLKLISGMAQWLSGALSQLAAARSWPAVLTPGPVLSPP